MGGKSSTQNVWTPPERVQGVFAFCLLKLNATFSKEESFLSDPLGLPNAWADPWLTFGPPNMFFEVLCMIGLVDMKFEQMIFMSSHDFFDSCIKFMCLFSLQFFLFCIC